MNAYTFSDVLIKPQYSEVISRKNVDTSVKLNERVTLKLPIISANMKTITGFKMAMAMAENGALGILHRFNTTEQAVEDYKLAYINHSMKNVHTNNDIGVSIGVQESDKKRFDKLYEANAKLFCIDVAHGHHILVKNMLTWIKSKNLTDITLIAGNIATPEAAYDLADWGADIIKVGIGPGCFIPETLIKTIIGLKPIEDVKVGEYVLSHTGEYQLVTTTFTFDKENEDLIKINNDITCTKNHEIYVIHKNDTNIVTEDNIDKYAKWISAEELTNEYLLVELQEN